MVPDFSGLRKQSCDRTADHTEIQPLEPSSSKASSQIQSFLQPFCKKPLPSSSKPPHFCTKHSQNAAKPSHFLSTFRQNDTAEIAASCTLTRTASLKPDDTALFYQLWLAQPSWSPIIKKGDSWITIVNGSGKKVPLVLGTVESHYRRGILLGKRFGKLTNYLLIDVDINSPFHPRNDGIGLILAAMESLGLCRYLLIRSSASEGLHIYFPLAEPVSSLGIASAAHAALTTAGIKVAGGICELFPNKKAFNAEHNGHRLPLQQGSFILDDDFGCVSNDRAMFLQQWQHCAAGQDDALLAELLTEKPLPVPKRISVSSLPPIAWTGIGQSNEVMKQLVNYGDRYLGLNTIPTLGDWIMAIAPQLPGFELFASQESKNDLTRHNWAYRWAKSHFKSARRYAAKTSFDHNAMIAAEALERLIIALDKVVIVGKLGIRKLWKALSDISKGLFGMGFSWGLFQKHRKLIMERLGSSRSLGLSSGDEEDKNSSSSEVATTLKSGTEKISKKGLTELLTARCVTFREEEPLSASRTPSEPEPSEASDEAELAMGTAVIFQAAGSARQRIETRVTGKTTQPDGTLLYRLEECAEGKPLMVSRDCLTVVADGSGTHAQAGVIRATAAQLLQVLGQACPFVGPGLWTVKRDEVSATAWGQLKGLVGEA